MTLKEAHKKALVDAGWAMCKESGGAGPEGCSPEHCVCHGDSIAPVLGYLRSLEESGFVVVPKEATREMGNAAKTAGIFDPRVSGFTYQNMIAARPKLDEEKATP